MSENMDAISKEILSISKSEDSIINKIQKDIFFNILKRYEFTYEKLQLIFQSEIYTNEIQDNLNMILRKMKKKHKILISESVLFLEEFTKIKKILYFLDGESKWIIKNELSEKYNIELETNELYKLLS